MIALTSVNSGLGRLRQEEDCHEFEASQGDIVSSRSAWAST